MISLKSAALFFLTIAPGGLARLKVPSIFKLRKSDAPTEFDKSEF
jgi:hypothetical protein